MPRRVQKSRDLPEIAVTLPGRDDNLVSPAVSPSYYTPTKKVTSNADIVRWFQVGILPRRSDERRTSAIADERERERERAKHSCMADRMVGGAARRRRPE